MVDMANVIEQRISLNEKSICEKCYHRRVCRAIDNQPCFECNQFAKEVVRCRNCVSACDEGRDTYTCREFPYKGIGGLIPGDGFCSYGERREGE